MDDTKLLVFRSGDRQYGVPLGAVSAVIGQVGDQGPPRPASVFRALPAGGGKQASQTAVLLHLGGIQLIILVDKVLKVVSAAEATAQSPRTAAGILRLYALPAGSRSALGTRHCD